MNMMEKRKIHYVTPQADIVCVKMSPFAEDIHSVNFDYGNTPNIGVNEGDPEGDGKGAKGHQIWDEEQFSSRALWED